jgi:hypothetical protein
MKTLVVLFVHIAIVFSTVTLSPSPPSGSEMTVTQTITQGSLYLESKLTAGGGWMENLNIDHNSAATYPIHEVKMRWTGTIVEFLDNGNGYQPGDTTYQTYNWGGSWSAFTGSGNTYSVTSTDNKFQFTGVWDSSYTDFHPAQSITWSRLNFNSLRQNSGSKISLKMEGVDINKNANGNNVQSTGNITTILTYLGNPLTSAINNLGNNVNAYISYLEQTSSSPDVKYFIWVTIDYSTNLDFSGIHILNELTTVVTTAPLTTAPLTTAPLTTSPLTTSPITSGFDVSNCDCGYVAVCASTCGF